ncbi:MAG: hypothetical protein GX046_10030 [Tissierellia bacterium]|nr:hypothetical protein [Tissierellia bacterium]
MKKISERLEGFNTYWKSTKAESKKACRSRVGVLIDMLNYRFKYGFSALDYQVFGFAHTRDKKARLSYFGALDWANANYFLNLPKDVKFDFFNKIDVYKLLEEYYIRDILILEEIDDNRLEDFMKENSVFFAKEAANYGGFGIEKLYTKNFSSAQELRSYCESHKLNLIEEFIQQHPDVNKLYPKSVNSLRVTTILDKDNEVHFLPTILRMGGENMEIDNVSSGGVYVQVDQTGRISSHGFKEDGKFDLDGGHIVESHPSTGTRFLGYQLPHTDKAFALAKELAVKVPEYRYIGWDIALTESGVDLIELNTYAAYDMIQCYYQNPSHRGSYDEMVKLVGVDFRSLKDRYEKVRTQR